MKRRVLSLLVGRPGLRRRLAMALMKLFRARRNLSQPQLRIIRSLQSPDQVVYDANLKRWRPSSAAFGPSKEDGSLSGDLEELLLADGLSVDALYPAVPRSVGASTFTVGEAGGLGLPVKHDPVWPNWYHGSTIFPDGSSAISKAKRGLQKLAQDLIPIDEVMALKWYVDKHGHAPPGHP
jgi:hypothetical protein